MRRRNIERRVDPFDARKRIRPSARTQHEGRVSLFDDDIAHRHFIRVRYARHKIRDTEVLCQNRDLKRADFICNVTVASDGVCRRRKDVDAFFLHRVGDHIVRDDRRIETHFITAARRKARTLQVGPRFRTVEFQLIAAFFRRTQHHTDDRFAETLRKLSLIHI